MLESKTIEAVAKDFKKLKPSQKNYILGVMQGFLLAKEPLSKAHIPKEEKVTGDPKSA